MDEWDLIQYRWPSGADTFFLPHNQHLLVVQVLVFKAASAWFGVEHYLPYRIVLVTVHLAVVALLIVVAGRRLGPGLGLAAALPVAVLGTAWLALINPFAELFIISAGCLLGIVLLFDDEERRHDVAIAALLLLCVVSSEFGLAVAVGVSVRLIFERDRWRRMWIVAVPVGVYAVLVPQVRDPRGEGSRKPPERLARVSGRRRNEHGGGARGCPARRAVPRTPARRCGVPPPDRRARGGARRRHREPSPCVAGARHGARSPRLLPAHDHDLPRLQGLRLRVALSLRRRHRGAAHRARVRPRTAHRARGASCDRRGRGRRDRPELRRPAALLGRPPPGYGGGVGRGRRPRDFARLRARRLQDEHRRSPGAERPRPSLLPGHRRARQQPCPEPGRARGGAGVRPRRRRRRPRSRNAPAARRAPAGGGAVPRRLGRRPRPARPPRPGEWRLRRAAWPVRAVRRPLRRDWPARCGRSQLPA